MAGEVGMTSKPTVQDFGLWVQRAERGESFVYGRAAPGFRPPWQIMRAAMAASDGGLVALVQRREADGTFSYIAQRTWVREKPPAPAPAKDAGVWT